MKCEFSENGECSLSEVLFRCEIEENNIWGEVCPLGFWNDD